MNKISSIRKDLLIITFGGYLLSILLNETYEILKVNTEYPNLMIMFFSFPASTCDSSNSVFTLLELNSTLAEFTPCVFCNVDSIFFTHDGHVSGSN